MMKSTFMNRLKRTIKIFLICLNAFIVVLAIMRGIVAINPFVSDPIIEFDGSKISKSDKQKITKALEVDDKSNTAKCSFTPAAFLDEFLGYKNHEIYIFVKEEGDSYIAVVDRATDPVKRFRREYVINQQFEVVSKTPMCLPIF